MSTMRNDELPNERPPEGAPHGLLPLLSKVKALGMNRPLWVYDGTPLGRDVRDKRPEARHGAVMLDEDTGTLLIGRLPGASPGPDEEGIAAARPVTAEELERGWAVAT